MSKYEKIVCIKSNSLLTLNKIYLFKNIEYKLIIGNDTALLVYDEKYKYIGVFKHENFKTLKQLRQEKTDFLIN